MAAVTFDVPFVLGMMRLHEAQEMHQASHLADWIEARLEQGLHWFDHADIYGSGACETLFGQALRARPALAKRLHVVTKASIANDNPSAGGQLMQGEVSRVLNRLAGELVSTPAALALAWLRTLPGRPAPVVGSVKAERIADMLNGPEALPREAWYELLEAARGHCVA